MRIRIIGLEDAMRNIDPAHVNQPLRRFFTRAVIYMQGRARQYAPVDRGHLRNSIVYEVQPMRASVGVLGGAFHSPLGQKAFGMEYGTGVFSEAPPGREITRMPTASELDVWAQRHGFENGAHVAQIIRERGGVEPRRYMRRAMQDGDSMIPTLIQRMANEIGEAMGRG